MLLGTLGILEERDEPRDVEELESACELLLAALCRDVVRLCDGLATLERLKELDPIVLPDGGTGVVLIRILVVSDTMFDEALKGDRDVVVDMLEGANAEELDDVEGGTA